MSRLPILVFFILMALPGAGWAQMRIAGVVQPAPSPVFGARPEGPLPLAGLAHTTDSTKPRATEATQWKKGALIGGAAGALYFGMFTNGLCRASEDPSQRGNCLLSALGSAVVGAAMGGTLGALIGGQIPDREGPE